MGLWGMKYSDADDKWWVDLVLQDAPPAVRLDKVGGRVVTDGFDWCLTEIIVMPLMQEALSRVTSIAATAVLVFGRLLAHWAYGMLLGWLVRAESPRPSRLPEAERLAA